MAFAFYSKEVNRGEHGTRNRRVIGIMKVRFPSKAIVGY